MLKTKNLGKINDYVYDISLDGTVVNALGMNVVSNTDGFNFKLPDKFRYTDEAPYIGKGLNREVKKGEKYSGLKGDVAEFNDLFMRGKMGLGIDEVVASTINISRKNYCDYFPNEPEPNDIKAVGNSIKSKKMPGYIEKFLYNGLRLLLKNEGQKFIEEYYKYIDKIYNYQIPLRDIASRGKIKKTIKEYTEDLKVLTKAGRTKSRQAWYELVIKNNLKVDIGETIYYINTGKKKSHSDVKKVTHYYQINENGDKVDIIKEIEKEYRQYKKEKKNDSNTLNITEYVKKNHPNVKIEEEAVLNAILLPSSIIEDEADTFCEEGQEYNSDKYIDQFNKRITPLLVCFSKDIRDNILVNNPKDRKYFTEEETKLISGEPNKPSDQDTYEDLMTIEDKEIKFWISIHEEPPFVEECGMNWESIKKDYLTRMENERNNGICAIREEYNNCLQKLAKDDRDALIDDGIIPDSISKIVDFDPVTGNLISKEYSDVVIGSLHDIIDMDFFEDTED